MNGAGYAFQQFHQVFQLGLKLSILALRQPQGDLLTHVIGGWFIPCLKAFEKPPGPRGHGIHAA